MHVKYRIGSFNLNKFGDDEKLNRDIEGIARIIREENFDVVAFQEVFCTCRSPGYSERRDRYSEGCNRWLDQLVYYRLIDWDYCCDKPINSSGKEWYAYLWNKKSFKICSESQNGENGEFKPCIITENEAGADPSLFCRIPYFIRLQPLYGGNFELRLINIHIHYGSDQNLDDIQKRQKEYDFLTKIVYPGICQFAPGNHRFPYTIAMGDYNLNLFASSGASKNAVMDSPIKTIDYGTRTINVFTDQAERTTLKQEEGYSNNYDHFSYSLQLSPFSSVHISSVDAIKKHYWGDFAAYRQNVSDHLPIKMEFTV